MASGGGGHITTCPTTCPTGSRWREKLHVTGLVKGGRRCRLLPCRGPWRSRTRFRVRCGDDEVKHRQEERPRPGAGRGVVGGCLVPGAGDRRVAPGPNARPGRSAQKRRSPAGASPRPAAAERGSDLFPRAGEEVSASRAADPPGPICGDTAPWIRETQPVGQPGGQPDAHLDGQPDAQPGEQPAGRTRTGLAAGAGPRPRPPPPGTSSVPAVRQRNDVPGDHQEHGHDQEEVLRRHPDRRP